MVVDVPDEPTTNETIDDDDEKPSMYVGAPAHRPMTDEDIEKFADGLVGALPDEAFRSNPAR